MIPLGQAARLAWAGVPGLYRIARRAGLDRVEAGRVVAVSAWIVTEVQRGYAGRRWEQNAVRHFVWQAWLAARHGAEVAHAVDTGHERLSADRLDHQVDVRNSEVGRTWGEAHATELRGLSDARAVRRLMDAGERQWRTGELWTGRGGTVGPSH